MEAIRIVHRIQKITCEANEIMSLINLGTAYYKY